MNNRGRNDPCWCGSGRKYKFCHLASDAAARRGQSRPAGILLKSPAQVEGIRKSCQLARRTLDALAERIRPGISTEEIDRWTHAFFLEHGAVPATLGYRGYPKSVCTSLNEVVCHGIPDEKAVLREGDILNVDVTCILDGYFGDTSRMFVMEGASEEARRLVRVTRECMELGIRQVRPGGALGDVGHAIQAHAESHGYSVVRNIGGHGTGVQFHEEPWVPHHGRPGTGVPLRPGMTFTIEPMINAGGHDTVTLADQWTVVTADGSLSAQWEHTVLVTEAGVEVLTA